ncbi:hypothetical protein HMPREF9440_02051 [Sutterella parvirubra YIT 11816]|uniref:Uncharacterized protein n=1 Tax=Sutterella parvirubra YIT 11816 TaxID=762967 RepID=H3KH12_9BURK|nr:hypothetical protein HMPREF9440_02051 [Sutterella parvirubra YIT 11816]
MKPLHLSQRGCFQRPDGDSSGRFFRLRPVPSSAPSFFQLLIKAVGAPHRRPNVHSPSVTPP